MRKELEIQGLDRKENSMQRLGKKGGPQLGRVFTERVLIERGLYRKGAC